MKIERIGKYWVEERPGCWAVGDSVGLIYTRPTRKEALESVNIYECESCKGTGFLRGPIWEPNDPVRVLQEQSAEGMPGPSVGIPMPDRKRD